MPSPAAYTRPCRYCTQPILMTRLVGGRWRTFDPDPVDAGPNVYRYRADGTGMAPATGVSGYRLHVCDDRSRLGSTAADVIRDLTT